MHFIYSIYGVCLETDRALPGLIPTDVEPKNSVITVNVGTLPEGLDHLLKQDRITYYTSVQTQNGQPSLVITRFGNGYIQLSYADGTQFIVQPNQQAIWTTWASSSTLEDTVMYLLGPVLGFVLRLRGLVCLHGSAVVVAGRAIVLAGKPGAGKSTTAAALAARGCPVLADDLAVLMAPQNNLHDGLDYDGTYCDGAYCNGAYYVQPAYPYLRLWSPSVEALYGTAEALPFLTPTWNKRCLDLTQQGYNYCAEPLPLAGIYVLQPRHSNPLAPWIDITSRSRSLMDLVANTYAANLLDKQMRAHEFEVLSHLTKTLPIRRVTPHADFSHLPKLCDLLLEDARSLPAL